jgi:hypothetical protein
MAQGGSLKFVVEVAADQATGALNAISTAVNQAGIKMRTTMLGVGGGARGAGTEIQGFEGKLRTLKSEMAAGDRTINFFARSLNGIVPESSAAGQGIRLLADGLIGGLGLGFALQAVMMGVQLFTDHLKEEAKAQEEAAKKAREHAEAIGKVNAETARYNLQASGATAPQVEAAESIGPLDAQIAAKQNEIRELTASRQASLFDAQETMRHARKITNDSAEDFRYAQKIMAAAEEAKNKIAALRAELAKLQASRQALQGRFNARVNLEEAQEAAKVSPLGPSVEGFNPKGNKKPKTEHGPVLGPSAEGFDPEFFRRGDKAITDRIEAELDAEREASEERGRIMLAEQAIQDRIAKKAADLRREQIAGTEAMVRPMVSTFTNGLAQMMQGQMTFKEFMANIWQTMIGQVVGSITQMVTQWIASKLVEKTADQVTAMAEVTHHAGVAGAATAASVAAIPMLGPATALEAGEAMAAAVLGSMMPLASAAGGWQVPYDTLAMVHKDEKILPARYSKGLDRLVEGGGRGGSTYSPTIVAFDAAGAARATRAQASSVARELRRHARRRG